MSESKNNFAPDVALDALFQRNAASHREARALFGADGAALTFTETSNAVAALAQQIAALGLAPRSMVALLLPNGHELVLALLAVMRCGHVPVPMPVAWRKSDLVRACREAEAGALITTANYVVENLPQLAAEVAIEVFELSFPCAFGSNLHDGIIPLEISTGIPEVKSPSAASPGIGTLQPSANGVSFVLHSDQELLAAGLGAMLAAGIQGGDVIASAVSLSSFAGLASAFVPWLLSGGALTMLADASSKDAAVFNERTHLIAAQGALPALCLLAKKPLASAIAIHFSGSVTNHAFAAIDAARIVDVFALGEVCAIALPREQNGRPQSIPLGAIRAGDAGDAAPVVAETNIGGNGNIHVRGALVAGNVVGDQDWYDTGFLARRRTDLVFDVAAPADLVAIGALRFTLSDLERRIRSAVLVSGIEVCNDAVLGNKLKIACERPAEVSRALLDAGLPRVIANAAAKAETVRRSA